HLDYRLDRPIEDLQDFQRGGIGLEELSPTPLQRAVRRGQGPGSQNDVPAEAGEIALELQFTEVMRAARKARPGGVKGDSRAGWCCSTTWTNTSTWSARSSARISGRMDSGHR